MGRSYSSADRRCPQRSNCLGLVRSLQRGRTDPGRRSYDGTVRLWDVATQQQIGSALASGDGDAVRSVAFSPDGNILAAGYGNGVVQLWNVRYLTDVVPFLCASAGGSFTPAQWAQYVHGPAYQKTCP